MTAQSRGPLRTLAAGLALGLLAWAPPLPATAGPGAPLPTSRPPSAEAAEGPVGLSVMGDGSGRAVASGVFAAKAGGVRVERVVLPTMDTAPLLTEDAAGWTDAEGHRFRRVGVGRTFSPLTAPRRLKGARRATRLSGGDLLWTVEVESPGAVGVRIHVAECDLPVGARMVAYDAAEPTEAYGPWKARGPDGSGAFYTPTVFGERARLEVRIPAARVTESLTLTVDGIVHRYAAAGDAAETAPAGAGGAGGDRVAEQPKFAVDDSCWTSVTCDPQYRATVARAVAYFEYIEQGDLFSCSGTLLNDTDDTTAVPWLLTANHCVNRETVATTVECFWDYRASICDGSPPPLSSLPRTVGAKIAVTSSDTDVTLLRLTGSIPSGRFFAGWTADAVPQGVDVVGVHHPDGSHMRISYGDIADEEADFHRVRWTDGVTAPGSSGSALFNSAQQVVGQLCCGFSSCANPQGLDDYGRLDRSFSRLEPYLASGTGGNPELPEVTPDTWDPADDAPAGATLLDAPGATTQTHGVHTLSETDTADWFAVDLVAGGDYVFHSEKLDEPDWDPEGALFTDAAGTRLVAEDDDSAGDLQFRIAHRATVTGRHYLRVASFQPSGRVRYVLRHKLTTDLPSPVRRLRARARRGGTVQFRWRDRARGEDGYAVEIELADAWFRVADLKPNARAFRHRLGPGQGRHRYRVGPVNAAGGNWTEIDVRVRSRRVGADVADPVDDVGTGATPLLPADLGSIEGRTISAADGQDWYRIDLVQGTTYRFTATGARLHGVTATLFADNAGATQLATASPSTDGAPTDLVHTATSTTVHWLRITPGNPATFERYSLSWIEE